MSKPWKTVLVAWLAASTLAVAQAPPDSSSGSAPGETTPRPASGPVGGTPPPPPSAGPATPPGKAKPAPESAVPGMPPDFVPALPCAAPPAPKCPPPSPMITGIIMPPYCPPQAWLTADALFWWIRSQPNPQALLRVTGLTVPAGTPTALNDPTAQTVIGQHGVDMGTFTGGQLTGGLWLNYERCFGLEASGFYLADNTRTQNVNANMDTGLPILGRPFFDVNTGMESASPVSVVGLQTGDMTLVTKSRLFGGEANFLSLISSSTEDVRMTLLYGARYLNLTESMDITTNTFLLPGGAGLGLILFQGAPIAPPQGVSILDSFKTQNQFIGGQVGFRVEWFGDRWYFKGQGEVALGSIQQAVTINGSTALLSSQGGTVLATAPGGFLALASNSGQHNQTAFSVLPSLQAQLAYELIPNSCWLDLGYTFLAVTNTVRPGMTIDRNLNLAQAPAQIGVVVAGAGPANAPTVLFHEQTFWAHGISVGLRFTY